MTELAPGTVIAGHRIDGLAGRGGMGVVYRATHLALNRVVALKIIAPHLARDEEFRERFVREARNAAAVEHPNIVAVHDAGEWGELLYMTMRYIEGSDLGEVIRAYGPLPPANAVQVVTQAADALSAAHAHGLVHRDVKPGNLLIDRNWRVYLGDFGLTKRLDGSKSLTQTGMLVGTAQYAAPEQLLAKRVDARSDIYSLGCVLYFALTGHPPYEDADETVVMRAHLQAPRPSARLFAPETPEALDAVIARAMAIEREDRYQSAAEFAHAVNAAITGPDGDPATRYAPPPPPIEDPRLHPQVPQPARLPRSRARWAGIAAAVVLAALAAVAAAVLIFGGDGDSTGTATAATSAAGTVSTPTTTPGNVTVALGRTLEDIVAGEGGVWVTDSDVDGVIPVNPATGERSGTTITVGDNPIDIAVGGGNVWVGNARDDTLTRIDAATGAVMGTPVAVGDAPWGIAVDGGSVWVVNHTGETVTRVDAATGQVVANDIPVGSGPYDLAAADGSVWVVNYDDDTVTRIDGNTNQVAGDPIAVGDGPFDVDVADGTVWVTNSIDGTVTRIDAATGVVEGAPIAVGDTPRGIDVVDGVAWIALFEDDQVVRVDAASGTLTGTPVDVGNGPTSVAVSDEAAWVTNYEAGTVTRIPR